MNAGDTFFLRMPGFGNPHLWVVISDPNVDPQNIVIVNFTTFGDSKDTSCIIKPGEHPFVSHRTCVAYGGTQSYSLDQFRQAEAKGAIDRKQPCSPDLLAKIRCGAALSEMTPIKYSRILEAQGLIGD